jgi:thiol-disulfide isomerase/thioredoxin
MKRPAVLLLFTLLPALAFAAPAPGGPAPTAAHGPGAGLVVQEQKVEPAHLDAQLARLAREAARHHKRVLVYFGASWCVSCALLKPLFHRESNRALLSRWELVQVDVDTLPEGPVVGIPFDTIPFFIKLDGRGRAAGTLRGSELLKGRGSAAEMDAAFARFLGT